MPDQIPFISIISGIAIFALIISLWGMAVVYWRAKKGAQESHVVDRLNAIATSHSVEGPESGTQTLRLWHRGEIKTTVVHGEKRPSRIVTYIDNMRNALGWTIPLPTFVIGIMGMCLFVYAIALVLTMNPVFSILAPFLALYITQTVAKNKIAKEDLLFGQQLKDALGLATRSLRAGHPLMGAFQLIAEECDEPIASVFSDIVQQQNLGKSLEDAIIETARISRSSDLKLFAASTAIQIRSGGNVADMMDRLANVIADRMRLDRKVKVLVSQTQLSKKVLMVIPFLLFVYMYVVKPGYLSPMFTTPLGNLMLLACVVMLFIGNFIMNKISELDY